MQVRSASDLGYYPGQWGIQVSDAIADPVSTMLYVYRGGELKVIIINALLFTACACVDQVQSELAI